MAENKSSSKKSGSSGKRTPKAAQPLSKKTLTLKKPSASSPDKRKTKAQLIDELQKLRRKVTRLANSQKSQNKTMPRAAGGVSDKSESDYNFRQLLEHTPVGIALVDMDGNITYLNRHLVKTLGYTLKDVPDMDTWWVVGYPDEGYRKEVIARWTKAVEKAVAEKQDIEPGEYNVTCKDGRVRVIEIFGTTVGSNNLVIFNDITERKLAEEALKHSEGFLRSITESSPDYIMILDRDANIQYINMTLPGTSTEEVIGTSVYNYLEGNNALIMKDSLQNVIKKASPCSHEVQHTGADGIERTFESRLWPIKNDAGETSLITVTSTDITERTQARDNLRNERLRYQTLFEQSPYAVVLIDPETSKHIEFNDNLVELLGYSQEEIRNLRISDFEANENPEEVKAHIEKVLREGQDEFETKMRTKGGELKDVVVNIKVIEIDGKKVFHNVFQDITKRKRLEESLKKSEERFRNLIEKSNTAIGLAKDQKHIFANKAFSDLFGYSSPDEVIGTNIVDFVATEAQDKLKESNLKREAGENSRTFYEVTGLKKDGTQFPMEVSVSTIELKDGVATLAYVRDITKRRKAEESLKTSESYLLSIMNNTDDFIMVADKNGLPVAFNNAYKNIVQEVFGIEMKVGLQPHKHLPDKEERERWDAIHKDVLSGAAMRFEYEVPLKGEMRLFEFSLNPIKAGDNINGFVEIARDITERRQAEKETLSIKQRFEDVAKNTREWIWEVDANGKYTYSSPVVEDLLGYSPEEVLGKYFHDFLHPEDKEQLMKKAFEAFAKKEPFKSFENRNIHKDGKTVILETSGVPILDSKGDLLGYRGADRDVTKRKQAEESLRLFNKAVMTSTVGITFSDTKNAIRMTNQAEADMHGYSIEELIGMDASTLAPEELHSPIAPEEIKNIRGWSRESVNIRKDGSRFSVYLVSDAVLDESGAPLGIITVSEDITDRKQAEEALRAARARLEHLLQHTPAVIYTCKATGDFGATFISDNLRQQMGYEPDEFTADPLFWRDRIHPDDTARVFEALGSILETGHHSHEYRFRSKEGSYIWVYDELRLVRGEDGKPVEMVGYWVDITERKEAEQALKESEEKYRTLFTTSSLGIQVSDREGRITLSNPAHHAMQGASEGQLIGKYVWDFQKTKEEKKFLQDYYKQIIHQQPAPEPFHTKNITLDGRALFIRVDWNYLFDSKGEVSAIYSVISDITEQRNAEAALKETAHYTSRAQEISHLGHYKLDPHTLSVEASDELLRIFGLTGGDKGLDAFVNAVHPDDLEYDLSHIARGMEHGEPWDIEHRLLMKDGTVKWVHAVGEPVLDEDGGTLHVVGIVQDITEHKQAQEDLKNSEEKYRKVISSSPIGIVVCDSSGQCVSTNKAMAEIIGATPEQVLKQNFHHIESWKTSGLYEKALKALKQRKTQHHDAMLRTSFGKDRYLDAYFVPFASDSLMVMMSDITKQKKAEELEVSLEQSRKMSIHSERIKEAERKRIAREVHDDLGQNLTGIFMEVMALKQGLPMENELIEQRLSAIASIANDTITSVQRISHELRSSLLDTLGISAAIENELDIYKETMGMGVEMRSNPKDMVVPIEITVQFYRIFQEAMTNIVRHADAKNIFVSLSLHGGLLTLEVKDDGRGIKKEHSEGAASLGLLGIRERAALLGGTVSITGQAGKGTALKVEVPLPAKDGPLPVG